MNQQVEFTNIFPESFLKQLEWFFHSPFAGPTVIDLTALACSLAEEKERSSHTDWLSESERKTYNSFKFQKRFIEWLAGRLCAKQAITDYIQKFHSLQIIPAPRDLIVLSQQSGRPFLQCTHPDGTPIKADISISHGGRYGMAMASRTWCGIDIQEERLSLEKVKGKYCIKTEEDLLKSILSIKDLPPLHQLTLLWTAKEALKKMLSKIRMIGFLEITLENIELFDGNSFLFQMRIPDKLLPTHHINVVTVSYNSYGIALCQLPNTLSTTLENS